MFSFKLTVEVPQLLCQFSVFLIGNLVINLNMYKVCYNILQYPEANCSRLGRYTDNSTKELEKIVQPHAGTMTSVSSTVPDTVTILLTLALGSLSDKYGRKPVLLYTITCLVFTYATNAIMLCFKEINPWFLMFASVPVMMCGGFATFFVVILSYLNDISSPDTKAMRMVTFDVIQILSSVSGGLCSSYLLYATSYQTVFGICTLLALTALVHTYYFIPESLKEKKDESPNLSGIFTCKNFTDFIKVATKKRKYNQRSIIIIIMAAILSFYFIESGENIVKTLYLRYVFNWTLEKKNLFGSWSSALSITCTLSSTYLLHHVFKIKEVFLIILASCSMAGSSLLYALGNNDNYIYLAAVVGMFTGLSTSMLKTKLAKLAVPEEMGKIFSLIMVANNIFGLVSVLAYQQIYNVTLDSHPQFFNYVTIILLGIISAMIIIVMVLESQIPFEQQQEENKQTVINNSEINDREENTE